MSYSLKMPSSLKTQKTALRSFFSKERALQLQKLQTENGLSGCIERLNKSLYELIMSHDISICAGYYPIKNEISVLPMMGEIEAEDIILGLPIVTDVNQPLIFRQWQQNDVLEKGAFNIPEPPEARNIVIPSCVIVPLLAFDNKGYRLGYGGGFYDRTLSGLREDDPDLLVIGVGFEAQKSSDLLPIDAYDQSLNYVVTEHNIYDFS